MVSRPLDPHLQVQSLYLRHRDWLQGWLRRRLGCPAQADDVSQDVFLRLMLRPALEQLDEPRAYLTVIARGLVIEHWRRRDLERAWLEAMSQLPAQIVPPPEEGLASLEALLAIDRMLDGLKPRVRQAFLLARLEGLSCRQIGERLGISLATAERHVAAGLRHCYKACFGG